MCFTYSSRYPLSVQEFNAKYTVSSLMVSAVLRFGCDGSVTFAVFFQDNINRT